MTLSSPLPGHRATGDKPTLGPAGDVNLLLDAISEIQQSLNNTAAQSVVKSINGTAPDSSGNVAVTSPVASVAGRTGSVTLTSADISDLSTTINTATSSKASKPAGNPIALRLLAYDASGVPQYYDPASLVSPSALAALGEVASLPGEQLRAGIPFYRYGKLSPTTPLACWRCVDVDLPVPAGQQINLTAGGTTYATTTAAAAGVYRMLFPSQVTDPANQIYYPVPTIDGGAAAVMRSSIDTAFSIGLSAPSKPTNVTVGAVGSVANVTWTAPTGGADWYTIYKSNSTGAFAYFGKIMGLGFSDANYTVGDTYAVEAVKNYRGSGPTTYVGLGGVVAGPSFVNVSSSGLSDGAIPTTSTNSPAFISTPASNGASAVFTSGRRVVTSGTTSNDHQWVKIAGAPSIVATGALQLKHSVSFGDTGATAWLVLTADSNPVSAFTKGIRVNLSSAAVNVGAKAPQTVFGAGTSGGYSVIPKADASTGSTYPAIGSSGATIVWEFTAPDATTGAVTVNLYTATNANYDAAYAGNLTTLVHTITLTSAQAQALFGTSGSPTPLFVWEATQATTTTQHAITYGPVTSVHVGA